MDGKSVSSRLAAVKAAGGVAKKAIVRRVFKRAEPPALSEEDSRALYDGAEEPETEKASAAEEEFFDEEQPLYPLRNTDDLYQLRKRLPYLHPMLSDHCPSKTV